MDVQVDLYFEYGLLGSGAILNFAQDQSFSGILGRFSERTSRGIPNELQEESRKKVQKES